MMPSKLYILETIRTNNSDAGFSAILALWQRQLSDPRVGEAALKYGVYSDYVKNHKADYSLSIATETIATDHFIEIPAVPYKIFQVDPKSEQAVYETWKKIWVKESSGLLKRAYLVDFEKYYPDGRVEIYISVHA